MVRIVPQDVRELQTKNHEELMSLMNRTIRRPSFQDDNELQASCQALFDSLVEFERQLVKRLPKTAV